MSPDRPDGAAVPDSASGATATAHLPDNASALPVGARIAEFEIRSVLGSGGFGIVYLAWDHALEREVALKEYMPGTLAGRGGDLSVSVRSTSMAGTFALGLRSFVNEARLLARFDHPSLVKVYRFWEDNGTAYMVMPYYKGRTLRRTRAGMVMPPGEGACRKVLDAVLAALEVLHKEGVFHRDIAPDNILIGEDGVPVLLDFGAARRVIEGGDQKALTSIMKPHFAPLEQYADQSAMRQGSWTDLYALGGTIYFLLTGAEPVPAASRALHDDQPRLNSLGLEGCSAHFLDSIDWMLEIRPAQRPQSVQMLREVLEGRMAVPGHVGRDRTIPGIASRDSVDILTSPGDLAPAADGADGAGNAPTVLMPPPPPPPQPLPLPAAAAATQPPAQLLPQRSSMLVLACLVLLNVLAWWWFTRGDAPSSAPQGAMPVAALPAPAASAAAPAATRSVAPGTTTTPTQPTTPTTLPPTTTPPVSAEPNETILSVLPARAPRPSAAASSAPAGLAAASAPAARVLDAPALPRAAAPDSAATPRVADAAANRGPRPAVAEPLDPRARCGERNFLSMLVCIKRECTDPAVSAHAECVRLREQEAAHTTRGSDR
jgi:serine/threonine protein kinase